MSETKRNLTLVFTNIQHGFRRIHDLTCNDYVLCDMVYCLSTSPECAVKDWCYKSREMLAKEIGVSRRKLVNMINDMVDRELLVRHNVTNYLKTTSSWNAVYLESKHDPNPKLKTPHAQNAHQPMHEMHGGHAQNAHNKNIDNNSNTDKNKTKKERDLSKGNLNSSAPQNQNPPTDVAGAKTKTTEGGKKENLKNKIENSPNTQKPATNKLVDDVSDSPCSLCNDLGEIEVGRSTFMACPKCDKFNNSQTEAIQQSTSNQPTPKACNQCGGIKQIETSEGMEDCTRCVGRVKPATITEELTNSVQSKNNEDNTFSTDDIPTELLEDMENENNMNEAPKRNNFDNDQDYIDALSAHTDSLLANKSKLEKESKELDSRIAQKEQEIAISKQLDRVINVIGNDHINSQRKNLTRYDFEQKYLNSPTSTEDVEVCTTCYGNGKFYSAEAGKVKTCSDCSGQGKVLTEAGQQAVLDARSKSVKPESADMPTVPDSVASTTSKPTEAVRVTDKPENTSISTVPNSVLNTTTTQPLPVTTPPRLLTLNQFRDINKDSPCLQNDQGIRVSQPPDNIKNKLGKWYGLGEGVVHYQSCRKIMNFLYRLYKQDQEGKTKVNSFTNPASAYNTFISYFKAYYDITEGWSDSKSGVKVQGKDKTHKFRFVLKNFIPLNSDYGIDGQWNDGVNWVNERKAYRASAMQAGNAKVFTLSGGSDARLGGAK